MAEARTKQILRCPRCREFITEAVNAQDGLELRLHCRRYRCKTHVLYRFEAGRVTPKILSEPDQGEQAA